MLKESTKIISLSELSIITSIKIDSPDRLRNWDLLIKYFQTFFIDWEIIVVEEGDFSGIPKSMLPDGVLHHFIQTNEVHYKTRNLNLAASLSTRKYLMMCDVDVLILPAAILEGLTKLKSGTGFVSPYNGIVVEVKKESIPNDLDFKDFVQKLPFFEKNYDQKGLIFERSGFIPMYGNSRYDSTGGALMFTRLAFFEIGGWNTNVVSYGFEDMEMHERIVKLGYQLEKLQGFNGYHFEHARCADSTYNNFYRTNQQEFERVAQMNKSDLRAYVNRGFRMVKLSPKMNVEVRNNHNEYAICIENSNRYNLENLSIIFAVRDLSPAYPADLLILCKFLENYFDNYEIIIAEIALRKYKYLHAQKFIHYFWLKHTSSLSEAAEVALHKTVRKYIELNKVEGPIQVKHIQEKLRQLLTGTEIDAIFG